MCGDGLCAGHVLPASLWVLHRLAEVGVHKAHDFLHRVGNLLLAHRLIFRQRGRQPEELRKVFRRLRRVGVVRIEFDEQFVPVGDSLHIVRKGDGQRAVGIGYSEKVSVEHRDIQHLVLRAVQYAEHIVARHGGVCQPRNGNHAPCYSVDVFDNLFHIRPVL